MSSKKASHGIAVQKPGIWLILLFVASSVLRYLLTRETVNMPTIAIDEGLYINIARSIFCEGKVLYRAQPVSYVYLLYPLALAPLFLLPASISLYRAAQVYNALLISSVVFPAYLLGKQLKLTKEKAVLLAALTALLPDLSLSSFLTAESLYYPLMVWAFYLAAKVCTEKNGKLYILFGALTGLLYFAKPVCVIFGGCFILIDLIRRIRAKQKVLPAVVAFLAAAGVIVLGYAAYTLCFGKTTLLNLYEKQTMNTTVASIPIMLQSILYHLLGFVFACGGVCILLPVLERKCFPAEHQELLLAGAASLLASVIGVAVMVTPLDYHGSGLTSPLNLRYIMFYVPLALAFLFSPVMAGQRKKSLPFLVVLLITTALFLFPSAFRFFFDSPGYYDSPSLVAFCMHENTPTMAIVLMAAYVLFAAVLIIADRKEWRLEKLVRCGCVAMAFFFLLNNVSAYNTRGHYAEDEYEESATALAEYLVEQENALVVATNRSDNVRGFQIDAHVRQPIQMVTMNDMLLHMDEHEGAYVPFVPVQQEPNTSCNCTIDADTFIFDVTTADYVEFAEGVETFSIGDYTIAKFTQGQPILKTGIAGMDGFIMPKNKTIRFMVFDPAIRAQDTLSVSFRMQCAGEKADLVFTASGISAVTTLDSDMHEFIINLPLKEPYFQMTTTEDINLFEYHTVIQAP